MEPISFIEAHWHTYIHIIPAVNLGVLILLFIFLGWVAAQTLKNRKKIMELEMESRRKTEEGLFKILNKIEKYHPEDCECCTDSQDKSLES